MSSSMVSKSVGCHKCGQRGHWARDCTNPPTTSAQRAERDTTVRSDSVADEQDTAPVLETTGPASRKRAPRKKLSLSLLQDSKGIPDVQNNFYASMKSMFRGKGHEISDTRRLLELYKRWNDRVLPSSGPNDTFDTFIAETEKLSSAGEVKHMMNNKREELLEFALDASKLELGDPIEPLVVDGGNQTDEDELMDLAMTNDDHGTNNEQSIDHNDDEMLALVEAGDEQGTNAEPAELQDDELLDLLFEH